MVLTSNCNRTVPISPGHKVISKCEQGRCDKTMYSYLTCVIYLDIDGAINHTNHRVNINI